MALEIPLISCPGLLASNNAATKFFKGRSLTTNSHLVEVGGMFLIRPLLVSGAEVEDLQMQVLDQVESPDFVLVAQGECEISGVWVSNRRISSGKT